MVRARVFVKASIRNRLDGSYKGVMSGEYRERLPDDLEPVAASLSAHRAEADPLQLDQLKQRAIAQSTLRHRRPTFMKTRIATVLTIVGLAGSAGGALAVGAAGGHPGGNGGAADAQYRPGKGCGDKNHKHTGPPGNPGNHRCPHH
jgi:hypothetical protein